MKSIETTLREEMYSLEQIVKETRKRLKTAPEGHLRIMKKRGGVEYYYRSVNSSIAEKNSKNDKVSRNSNGRYMRKSEINLARAITQRDYDTRILKNAEERIKSIASFLEKYKKTNLEKVYEKTSQCRRELISVPIICESEFVKQWQAVRYAGKPFADEAQEIITERGERVRSKSEKIIADKLHLLGIPYRYEYPLVLEENIKLYPDFTILKMPDREEVYLEHFGMMDDSNYVDTVIHKLNVYERNGIYLGVNLFITYESSKRTLNTRTLDKLIKKLFCVEC